MRLRLNQRGVSLLETITVTGIMGILTALAVPQFRTMREQSNLLSVQREVLSAVTVARSSAILANASRQLIFTPPTTITIKDTTGTTTYYTRNLKAYGSVKMSGSTAISVPFDARGLLNPPNAVTMTFSNGTGQSTTLTVYPSGKAALG